MTIEKPTREEKIKRLEKSGLLDPNCKGCEEAYAAADPTSVFGPRHKASSRCKSGGYNHCTCDTCF